MKQSLGALGQTVSKAASQLAEAVSVVALDRAKREAEQKAREERRRQRDAIFDEAVNDLKRIKERLFSRILDHARDVVGGWQEQIQTARLTLGSAAFVFDVTSGRGDMKGIRKSGDNDSAGGGGWGVHQRQSQWDIIAYTHISIVQSAGHQPYMRSANLVFGRPNNDAEYRWFEMAFWSLGGANPSKGEPCCLEYVWEIDRALAPIVDVINLAHDPVPIDGENEDTFIEYWMGIGSFGAIKPAAFHADDKVGDERGKRESRLRLQVGIRSCGITS